MNDVAQAILLGILYWVPWTRIGYSFSNIFRQPLSLSVVIGIITGEIPQAVMLGAALQLLYLVIIPAGSTIPADEALSACVVIPLAIKTGLSAELAMVLAIPVGLLGTELDKVRRTVNARFVEMADSYAAAGCVWGIITCAAVYPLLLQLPLRVIPVFIVVWGGAGVAAAVLPWLPPGLVHGLEVAGSFLPAAGFALTLTVIGRRNLLPYFILGFFLVKYMGLDITAIFIFGVCVAALHTQSQFTGDDPAQPTQTPRCRPAPEGKEALLPENGPEPLTKLEISLSWLRWYVAAEMSNSFARLQSLAFCASMAPLLARLYQDKQELSRALSRYLAFFNTQGIWGSIVPGMVIALEEKKARGEAITGDVIDNMKTNIMGPIAGIGDTIDWGLLKPILMGLFIPLAMSGNALGSVFPFTIFTAVTMFISYKLWHAGYKSGQAAVAEILASGKIQRFIFAAGIVGLFMMGALAARYVHILIPGEFSLPNAGLTGLRLNVDSIVPGLLPLAAIGGVWWYFVAKGPRFLYIYSFLVIVCVALALLDIL